MLLNATCGISPMATDKTRQVPQTELKETSFVWIGPARDCVMYPHSWLYLAKSWGAGDLGKLDDSALVRLFVHGGGYMMWNGSKSFSECGMRLYYYTLLYCGMLSGS
jgi:hypothetical protein